MTEILLGRFLFVCRRVVEGRNYEILQKSFICHSAEDTEDKRRVEGKSALGEGHIEAANTPVDKTYTDKKVAVHLHQMCFTRHFSSLDKKKKNLIYE